MLAFDLYVVLGLIALVVLAFTAVLVVLLGFAVQAGLGALKRWVTERGAYWTDECRVGL